MDDQISQDKPSSQKEKSPSKKTPRRKFIRGVIALAILIAIVVAGRGLAIAYITDGIYPLSAFAFEFAALLAIVLIMRAIFWVIGLGIRRIFRGRPRIGKAASLVVQVLLLVVVVIPFLIVTLQLHPQRVMGKMTPSDAGMEYQDVTIDSDGLKLAAWFIPSGKADAPVAIIAHGFNANKSDFLTAAVLAQWIGCDVLIFDSRGHGYSEGHTATFGWREAADVKAAYDWVKNKYPDRAVYGMGFSMNGAAVIRAEAKYGIFDRIWIDSSFGRIERVADNRILRFVGPFRGVVWNVSRFWWWVWTGEDIATDQPEDFIARIKCPILITHGGADKMIPADESRSLDLIAGAKCQLFVYDNAGHLESMSDDRCHKAVKAFFATSQPASMPVGE